MHAWACCGCTTLTPRPYRMHTPCQTHSLKPDAVVCIESAYSVLRAQRGAIAPRRSVADGLSTGGNSGIRLVRGSERMKRSRTSPPRVTPVGGVPRGKVQERNDDKIIAIALCNGNFLARSARSHLISAQLLADLADRPHSSDTFFARFLAVLRPLVRSPHCKLARRHGGLTTTYDEWATLGVMRRHAELHFFIEIVLTGKTCCPQQPGPQSVLFARWPRKRSPFPHS